VSVGRESGDVKIFFSSQQDWTEALIQRWRKTEMCHKNMKFWE